jgi:hypothetical protein
VNGGEAHVVRGWDEVGDDDSFDAGRLVLQGLSRGCSRRRRELRRSKPLGWWSFGSMANAAKRGGTR